MTSLETFPLFPKLTPELRIHIWHHALLIPRLVLIWKHEKRGSDYLRRSSSTPLLSVNHECRREALAYHSSLSLLYPLPPPFSHPSPPFEPQSSLSPSFIGPGTDILYIRGVDPQDRRYKPISWTCITLSRDLESEKPTFAPVRRVAVDAVFLRETGLYQFGRMPYSVWKLVVSDLRGLEELVVVVGNTPDYERRMTQSVNREGMGDGIGSEGIGERWGGMGVEKRWVERKLREAKEGYKEYMECVWADEVGGQEIGEWRLPMVRVVTFEELVGMCWTSWE